MLDINRIKVTGDAEHWVALPDGYEPTVSYYARQATGGRETLAMLRDIASEAKRLPSDGQTYLVFEYSAALFDDPKHGRDIKRQVKDIERKSGIYCSTTQAARPTR